MELVQDALQKFTASGEPAWEMLHDEVEVHDHDIMDASEYRGHEGFRRWLEDWAAAWSESTMEPEDFLDAGDWIVVFILQKATGQGSGISLERHDAMVFELRDGKIARLDYYNNRAQALKAVGVAVVGLEEQAVAQDTVEVVRRIYEEINARLEFPREWLDPDCITDFTEIAPDGELNRGVDAANAAIASYFGTFASFRIAAEEIMHADRTRVVVAIRDGGRIRGSDAEISSRYFHAWTFRDGRVIRLSSHTDEAAALKAAGLAG